MIWTSALADSLSCAFVHHCLPQLWRGTVYACNTGQLFHFCVSPHTLTYLGHQCTIFPSLVQQNPLSLMDSSQQSTDMQQEKCHQQLKVRNKEWKQPRRRGEGRHEKTVETSFSLSLSHTHTQIHTTPLDSVPSLPSEHGLCLFSHFSSPFSPWIRSSHCLAYHGNCYQVTNDLDAA